MSYCRWSDDDFQCDLYIYASCYGGYETHVAGRRYVFKEPLPEPVDSKDFDKWWNRHQIVSSMVEVAELVPIGLPCDGESFNDTTLKELLARVIELKQLGYRVPDYAITRIESEIEQFEATNSRGSTE
jgi:hypothetical protein